MKPINTAMFTRHRSVFAAVIATLLAGFSSASAAPVPIVNPGFEDVSVTITTFNEFTFGPLNGWDLYDPDGVAGSGAGPDFYIGTLQPQEVNNPGVLENYPGGAPEGDRLAIAFNNAEAIDDSEYGFIQELATPVTANTTYTLEVEVGNILTGQSVSGDIFNLDGFPGYRIDLLAIDAFGVATILDSDDNSLAGTIPEGEFRTSSFSVDTGELPATLGQSLGIRLVNLNVIDTTNASTTAADREVNFDDVRLTAVPTVIPEPTSLALLLAGGISLHHRRSAR